MSAVYIDGQPITWVFCPTCGVYRRMDEMHDCQTPITEQKPYCCPVCEGRGFVPCGFYVGLRTGGTDTVPAPCRSCTGTGVIWREKQERAVL